MPKFKIVEGEGIEAVIEKSEHTPTQFNVKDVKNHMDAVKKAIVELDAKIRLEKAIIENTKRNYPRLITMKEELKQAAYVLVKSKLAIIPAKEKLDELNEAMKEYEAEIKEMAEQTGIDILSL